MRLTRSLAGLGIAGLVVALGLLTSAVEIFAQGVRGW